MDGRRRWHVAAIGTVVLWEYANIAVCYGGLRPVT
jgi:hypothetical protein